LITNIHQNKHKKKAVEVRSQRTNRHYRTRTHDNSIF